MAIIEAVPIIEKWFVRLQDAYTDRQIAKHEEKYNEVEAKQHAYFDAIKKVKSDLQEGKIEKPEAKTKILHYRRLLSASRE